MRQSDEVEPETKVSLRPRALRYLPVVFIVLVAVSVGFIYFCLYRPAGVGPAGPQVAASFDRVWYEGEVLLLGIGDSVTAGFGASEGFSYFERLISNPPGDSEDVAGKNLTVVLPKLSSRNIAVSGSTSPQHFEKQVKDLQLHRDDVLGIVVMTTGGNDIIHSYGRKPPQEGAMYEATPEQAAPWVESFEQRLRKMLTMISNSFPGGCHIFLANIYDPTDGTGNPGSTGLPKWKDALWVLDKYNDVIHRCADDYDFVHMIDIREPFLGHGIHCTKIWNKNYKFSDPHYWYSLNVEDPNNRGYDALRRLFLIEIGEVFESTLGVSGEERQKPPRDTP
ncbi:SGNH/GDSL hydrolase family protein [Candidatus Hydrogenedentota bacterium]